MPHPPDQRRPRPRIPLPAIDPQRCTGCGRCIAVCGPHVLGFETVRWKKTVQLHDRPGCTGCSLCEARCPFGAITMQRPVPADDAS